MGWRWLVGVVFIGSWFTTTVLGESVPVSGASSTQEFQEETEKTTSSIPGKSVPFAGFEEQLRESRRWQTMTPEEQRQAIQKIERIRRQFMERQQRLNQQYEGLTKKKKPRESLMSKRKRRDLAKDKMTLWDGFQALPLYRRHELEKKFGLLRYTPSQRPQRLQDIVDHMPFSKRTLLLRELQ